MTSPFQHAAWSPGDERGDNQFQRVLAWPTERRLWAGREGGSGARLAGKGPPNEFGVERGEALQCTGDLCLRVFISDYVS